MEDTGFFSSCAPCWGRLLACDKITCKRELGETVPAAGSERASHGLDSARRIGAAPQPPWGGAAQSITVSERVGPMWGQDVPVCGVRVPLGLRPALRSCGVGIPGNTGVFKGSK